LRPSSIAQQPLHVTGLHAESSRPQTRLPSHSVKPLATQSEHCSPMDPHARTSLPVRHTPFASQQPLLHVEGPHDAAAPASRGVSSSRLDRPQPEANDTTRSALSVATISK
jgi:hypothetical protein